MATLTPTEGMEVCLRSRFKNRQGYGRLLGVVLACTLWGAREVLGLSGEEGSEQECSWPP